MKIYEHRHSDRGVGKIITIQYAVMCFTGKVRNNNEDNFYIDSRRLPMDNNGLREIVSGTFTVGPDNCRVAAVFDGVGGGSAGELASFIGAETLWHEETQFSSASALSQEEAAEICRHLNAAVCAEAEKKKFSSIGSTMTAAFFTPSGILSANLGDSQGFAVTTEGIRMVTQMHVLEEIYTRSKPPIFQYLGVPEDEMLLDPYLERLSYEESMQILLTTDGVTDLLSNDELYRILTKNKKNTPAQSLEVIRDCVMIRGAKDNTTAILCRIAGMEEYREL